MLRHRQDMKTHRKGPVAPLSERQMHTLDVEMLLSVFTNASTRKQDSSPKR